MGVILNEAKLHTISFVTNPNVQQIHVYDFNDWKSSTKNKTQFQIREFLKNNFGGIEKTSENRDWVKLNIK